MNISFNTRTFSSNTLAVLLLVFTHSIVAQGDVFTTAERYRFEQINPVNLEAPPRPTTRIGPGPEAWVKLRFSINPDGTTDNIEVLDFMPYSYASRDTVDAVENWVFEPATMEGSAVEWHNNIVVINLDLPEIPNLSGPNFIEPYNEVAEMINEDRLDRAARQGTTNLRNATFTLHDIGIGNMQLAVVEMRREDMHLALQAITRATLPEVNQLTNEELDVALQYRFNIEISLGRYVDALDTYDRRIELGLIPENDNMNEQTAQIRQALDEGYLLNAKAKIIDRDIGWFFIPSRRTFTISNIDGDVDNIEAVCNRRRITLEYQPDVEWSLPESWGECSVNVMGNRNTTFTFFEFPEE